MMDWLAIGYHVEITLTEFGTTEGSVFVPEQLTEPGEPADTRSLVGTWSLSGDVVHFDLEEDTFLRAYPFSVVGNTLRMEAVEGGAVGILVLTRND